MSKWSKLVVLVCGVGLVGCGGKSGNAGTDAAPDLGAAEVRADVCQPNCDGKECADDGCGGECGQCGREQDVCMPEDVCECVPDCEGKQCGPNGCGGTCGICCPGVPCQDGICLCVPDCKGRECGPDGAGGYCIDGVSGGSCWDPVPDNWGCPEGLLCDVGAGTCVEKTDGNCVLEDGTAKECGSDGAGGACGQCPCESCGPDEVVCNTETFQCESEVVKDCCWFCDCLAACTADMACCQQCVNEVDDWPEGIPYNALLQCLVDTGYFDCFDQFAANSPERHAYLEKTYKPCDIWCACYQGDGDLSCQELQQCFAACPEVPEGEPNPCISDCWSSGSVEAQKAYAAILECLEAQGYWDCAEADEKCIADAEAACSAEFDACFPPGTLTCKEIFDCMDTCAPSDQACFSTCLQSGTKEAQGEFGAIVDCVAAECGEESTPECEDAALAGSCTEAYAQCMGE